MKLRPVGSRVLLGIAATGILAAAVVLYVSCRIDRRNDPPRSNRPYQHPPVAFEGRSEDLQRSVVVPTLDTPIEPGKNVIWCGSFQLAWNELRDDVVGEPVWVSGAEQLSSRLNRASFGEADVPPDCCYAAAGWVKDGIVEEIRNEMKRRFDRQPELNLTPQGTLLVAFAYLQANVPFEIPFFENQEEFLFTDSEGSQTAVTSFGIRNQDGSAYDRLREQVEVLYALVDDKDRLREFVVDPCRDSVPNQIVLASVPPKENLLATLKDVERKVTTYGGSDHEREFGLPDTLLVPNLNLEITHRFMELVGPNRQLLNAGFEGLWVADASQIVRFRLDRSGVELASEAAIPVAALPRQFVFDRPFLICLKKRGADRPFFVMWVDNAELLSK